MLWVYDQHKNADSYSAGIDFTRQNLTSTDDDRLTLTVPSYVLNYTESESDVYRRQILTTKVDLRNVRVNYQETIRSGTCSVILQNGQLTFKRVYN